MYAVVGTFDNDQGRPSSIGAQIISHLNCDGINGGNLRMLDRLDFSDFDALLWMPNIDNAEDKLISRIKAQNRKLLLISSKRCVETEYTEGDVVGRLLKTRSNLGIMIERDERYQFKLIDPLGNIFCNTSDIETLCDRICRRVSSLLGLTRWPSVHMGERKEFSIDPAFIEIVHSYGDRFAEFVNAVNVNRFLGNAATRCSFGFPAQKSEGRVFVSRRNVDKQGMTEKDFVEVAMGNDQVLYLGNQKPSVDSPIQLKLFGHYPNVNYMIHGHVYVKNALRTHRKVPCGALEEFDEITELFPNTSSTNFVVNLRGHGCLVLAGELSFFKRIELQGRPFPEG